MNTFKAQKLSSICIIIVTLSLTGCIYYPQVIDMPLISEKKDLRIDGGISLTASANATVSYGLTEKVSIQAFANIAGDNYYFQGAAGIFRQFDNKKIMEFYSGFGYGYGKSWKVDGGELYGNYQQYFLQSNFGKIDCTRANIDFGFGLKTGLLHSNLTDNYYYYWPEEHPVQNYASNRFLIEPGLFFRIGGERLKFNIKAGGCRIYNVTNTDKRLPYSPLNIGLGVNYRFRH
jgi:hypothetical protein